MRGTESVSAVDEGPLIRSIGRFAPATIVVSAAALLAMHASAQDWSYPNGDANGTNRSVASGAISDDPGLVPGMTWSLALDELNLGSIVLIDVGADATPDIITATRGTLLAAAGGDGSTLWQTAILGLGQVIGPYDLDGDGIAGELVATASGVGGGLHVVDSLTGGVLWSFVGLEYRSGVQVSEVLMCDADGDGFGELFFTDALGNSDNYYVASFLGGFGDVQVANGALPGSYLNTNWAACGALSPDDDVAFIVTQGRALAAIALCDAGDPGASCSADDSLCVCDAGLFEQLHDDYAVGHIWAQDVDGDGEDEVLHIPTKTDRVQSVALLDVGQGLSSGIPVNEDLVVWQRDYTGNSPSTVILLAEELAEDVTGDGNPDLVISFFNNIDTETDLAGLPFPDDIDHADAFAVGVFDAQDGSTLAVLEDHIAFGSADLDGDGIDEIVTGTTSGWSYLSDIEAYSLDCSPDCSWTLEWSAAGYELGYDLQALDSLGFPELGLNLVDVEMDGDPELLAFAGPTVSVLDVEPGGAVSVEGIFVLQNGQEIDAVATNLSGILLNDGTSLESIGPDGTPVGAPFTIPGQAQAEVLAMQLDPGDPMAVPIVDGAVFWSNPEPATMSEADIRLGKTVAFGEDLDGDGFLEIATYISSRDSDDGTFQIIVGTYDPTDPDGDGTPLGVLWEYHGSDHGQLDGADVRGKHSLRSADVDGDGQPEVVAFLRTADGDGYRLVLEGSSGAVLDDGTISFLSSAYVPIWVGDTVDTNGAPGSDGLDDLVLGDNYDLYLIPGGATAVVDTLDSGVWHSTGAFGDLDGDGGDDVAVFMNSSTEPKMAAVDLGPPFSSLWGGTQPVAGGASLSKESRALLQQDGDVALEIAFGGGEGTLELYDGANGTLISPVMHMDGGQQVTKISQDIQPTTALIACDIDGDGFEEVLAGAADGYLYAFDVASGDPDGIGFQWAIYNGVQIDQIRVADIDGDGSVEILTSGPDSTVRAYDGIGTYLEITYPGPGECVPTQPLTVTGIAHNLDVVDIYVGGVLNANNVPISGEDWEAEVSFAGYGTWSILAFGFDPAGQIVAQDEVQVLFAGDEDGDGYSACGDCDDADPDNFPGNDEVCDGQDNDCDGEPGADEADADGDGYRICEDDCDDGDESVHPDAEEICEDGIDNDCDGTDEDCGSDPYPTDDDDGGTGGCECGMDDDPGSGPWIPAALILGVSLLGLRRRRGSPMRGNSEAPR